MEIKSRECTILQVKISGSPDTVCVWTKDGAELKVTNLFHINEPIPHRFEGALGFGLVN